MSESTQAASVARDQCRGYDLCCVNCGVPLGGRHKLMCHAFAKAVTAERREREREAASAPSLWRALSAEYHREPNVGHGTGRNIAGARACYECRRIESLVLRCSQPKVSTDV